MPLLFFFLLLSQVWQCSIYQTTGEKAKVLHTLSHNEGYFGDICSSPPAAWSSSLHFLPLSSFLILHIDPANWKKWFVKSWNPFLLPRPVIEVRITSSEAGIWKFKVKGKWFHPPTYPENIFNPWPPKPHPKHLHFTEETHDTKERKKNILSADQ